MEVQTLQVAWNLLEDVKNFLRQLQTKKLAIEANDVASKLKIDKAGAPEKAPGVRKARYPKKIFLAKAECPYRDYCQWKQPECIEPEKLIFINQWIKDWCKEYQIWIKKPK